MRDPSPIAAAKVFTLFKNVCDARVPGLRAKKEIDKARPGNLDLLKVATGLDNGNQLFGNITGFAACRFCQQQREVTGKIAMGAVAGALDHHGRRAIGGQGAIGLQGGDGVSE